VPFGTLPAGIVLDPAAGTLAGTAPNVTATYNFTIQVQDQVTLQVASRPYTLNIQGGIAIITPSLPNAYVGQAYSFQMQSSGGRTMVWSIPAAGIQYLEQRSPDRLRNGHGDFPDADPSAGAGIPSGGDSRLHV
jgi:hypothetical protein